MSPLLPSGPGPAKRLWRRARSRSRVGYRDADRLTLGLAALTATTVVGVAAGEFARRFRRRAAREEQIGHQPESLHLAGEATRDTLRVAVEGYTAATRTETVLFNLFSGAAGAFAFARLSAAGIRSGWWPFANTVVGGRHIHHFVPGILLAFGSGVAALLTESVEAESVLAVPFGVGVGLTMDEAALLLDLRDVYWTREGLLSVQLSFGVITLLGGTILALRMIRRGEARGEERGIIPDPHGDLVVSSPVQAPGLGA